jgi:hypothetical protein
MPLTVNGSVLWTGISSISRRDSFFDDVESLIGFDAGGFTDEKDSATWNDVGSAAINTTDPIAFDSDLTVPSTNGNYVSRTGLSDWTGDYTIECWAQGGSSSTVTPHLWDQRPSGTATTTTALACAADTTDSNRIGIFLNGSFVVKSTSGVRDDVPYHIALSRSGSTNYFFVDGVLEGTFAGSQTFVNSAVGAGSIIFGAASSTTGISTWDGEIDEIRITVGVGRYTSGFTPIEYFPRS